MGMRQTINTFSDYKLANDAESTVAGENIGVSATRYLVVNLKHLDMSVLHIKTDKQLRDVARVWKTMGLDPVTVTLDGGEDGKFTITQKTIDVINSINPEGDVAPTFKVKPCQLPYADEEHGVCAQIVITENSGNATIKDVDFIAPGDGGAKVEVVFANEATAWNWAGNVKVDEAAVSRFINQGKMENSATATLKTVKSNGDQNNVLLENKGTWNVKSPATLTVQFNVYNRKTVNIAKGAQYRQGGSTATTFFNLATDKPSRFGGDDTKIGLVNNNGVFATVDNGNINNYGGLIEHLDKDAKTYITKNEQGGNFSSAFNDGTNRMGRINLKWSNKDEDNVSISAALNKGFVSVTVTSEDAPADGILNAAVVGDKVNYVIVNSGISTISAVSAQVKYLEINDPSKIQPNEIVWKVSAATTYQGLMILSDVNIALGTEISSEVTYLGATGTMYVGGTFNKGTTVWNGYYGDTSGNVVDNYVTY